MQAKTMACCLILLMPVTASAADNASDMFIVRTTANAPETVIAAIRSHAKQKNWQYLGESKVKKGEVTLVKICIPEVGQQIWGVGLELSAMLPCGNVGIYRSGTATAISVLHPRYMHVLYPHAATERASAIAHPLLTEMLDVVSK